MTEKSHYNVFVEARELFNKRNVKTEPDYNQYVKAREEVEALGAEYFKNSDFRKLLVQQEEIHQPNQTSDVEWKQGSGYSTSGTKVPDEMAQGFLETADALIKEHGTEALSVFPEIKTVQSLNPDGSPNEASRDEIAAAIAAMHIQEENFPPVSRGAPTSKLEINTRFDTPDELLTEKTIENAEEILASGGEGNTMEERMDALAVVQAKNADTAIPLSGELSEEEALKMLAEKFGAASTSYEVGEAEEIIYTNNFAPNNTKEEESGISGVR